jgi:hypothetical protein
MNKIDDILEQLKGQQPAIDDPDALTDRIMESLPEQEVQPTAEMQQLNHRTQTVALWRWLSIAASILLIIGIGTTLMKKERTSDSGSLVAKVEETQDAAPVTAAAKDVKPIRTEAKPQTVKSQTMKLQTRESQTAQPAKSDETYDEPTDPNLHYASNELTKDTVPYQDPARVDSFIAKLAANYDVKQGELKCSQPAGSNVVSSVYVFPDNKEIDLFNRLLQVACCYKNETPGYFLNFSHQQFFFELKDMRKQLKYRWIAERVNGKILFYGTHAPLGTKESSACYQEYRDELMHINSINYKTKKI